METKILYMLKRWKKKQTGKFYNSAWKSIQVIVTGKTNHRNNNNRLAVTIVKCIVWLQQNNYTEEQETLQHFDYKLLIS